MFQSLSSVRRPGKRRRLAVQSLETRRLLAASMGWDGPGQGSAELTYTIANTPGSLSQAETNAAIETALAAWSNVVDVTFTPTNQVGLRDSIDFSFRNIDGVGGTLAQAYFPDDVNPARIAGDVQFDMADAWEVGNSLGSRAFDLVYVAVHEIGHALGLDHSSTMDSVLTPFVSPSQSFDGLDPTDLSAIEQLYAPAVDTATGDDETGGDPIDDSSIDNETDQVVTNYGNTNNFHFRGYRWYNRGFWFRVGGRLEAEAPEHNYSDPTDVDGDNQTSPLDALTVSHRHHRASDQIFTAIGRANA